VAGILFSTGETVLTLAMGWPHPSGYFLTCAALALALATAIGAAGSFLRVPVTWALLAWIFATSYLTFGIVAGIGLAIAAIPPVRASEARVRHGWLLGACAAGGLLLGFPRGESLAEAAGLLRIVGSAPGEAIVLAALFAIVYQLAPRLFVRWPRWGSETFFAVGVAALALLLSARPFLDGPPGTRRLPRPEELRADPRLDTSGRPHVILLVLDTLRADHLSIFGYDRETTPELARLLAERSNAVATSQAYANATWTVPSHASLFTGQLPNQHGVHFALDGSVRFQFTLAEDAVTLASRLRDGGYRTLGTFANNWLRIVRGMGDGFDRFFRSHHSEPLPFSGERLRALLAPGVHPEALKSGARAHEVNTALLSLAEPWSAAEAPLFLFANYCDVHGPYVPMPGYRGRFHPTSPFEDAEHLSIHQSPERWEVLEARYDEELLYLDHYLGRLFDELDRIGLLDESWVFVTSDHGEAFGEHGVTEHGTAVYDEIIRIPLLVFPRDRWTSWTSRRRLPRSAASSWGPAAPVGTCGRPPALLPRSPSNSTAIATRLTSTARSPPSLPSAA